MAHFAQIDSEGVVLQIIVIDNIYAPEPAPNNESIGQEFIKTLNLNGEWKQTSYNNNFRKRYAVIGGKYLSEHDVFIWPQPYPSWVLDENFDWQAPIDPPETGGTYEWDEETLSWIEIPS